MVFLVGPKGLVNKFVGDLVSLFFTKIFSLSMVPLHVNIKLFLWITRDRFKELSNNSSTCQISQVSGFFVLIACRADMYIYQSRQANRYLADFN